MLVNKWINLGITLLTGALTVLAAVDWTTMLPPKYAFAGAFVGLGIKTVLNVLEPPPGQAVVQSTGKSIVTHT